MKKVFVDTNIIIDLLADRKPFSKYAISIFNKAENKEIELFTSSHSIATAYYLLKKYLEEKTLRQILFDLTSYLNIISLDQDNIKKSLKSKLPDFEDAIQMHCAYSEKDMFCIITRNTKDFKNTEIQVFNPEEFLRAKF
jgi:predicted nucleic acid-binding protein